MRCSVAGFLTCYVVALYAVLLFCCPFAVVSLLFNCAVLFLCSWAIVSLLYVLCCCFCCSFAVLLSHQAVLLLCLCTDAVCAVLLRCCVPVLCRDRASVHSSATHTHTHTPVPSSLCCCCGCVSFISCCLTLLVHVSLMCYSRACVLCGGSLLCSGGVSVLLFFTFFLLSLSLLVFVLVSTLGRK